MKKYIKWIVLALILAFTIGLEVYKGDRVNFPGQSFLRQSSFSLYIIPGKIKIRKVVKRIRVRPWN